MRIKRAPLYFGVILPQGTHRFTASHCSGVYVFSEPDVCLCRFLICSPLEAAAAAGVWPFAVVSLPAAPEFSSSPPEALPFLYSNASNNSVNYQNK